MQSPMVACSPSWGICEKSVFCHNTVNESPACVGPRVLPCEVLEEAPYPSAHQRTQVKGNRGKAVRRLAWGRVFVICSSRSMTLLPWKVWWVLVYSCERTMPFCQWSCVRRTSWRTILGTCFRHGCVVSLTPLACIEGWVRAAPRASRLGVHSPHFLCRSCCRRCCHHCHPRHHHHHHDPVLFGTVCLHLGLRVSARKKHWLPLPAVVGRRERKCVLTYCVVLDFTSFYGKRTSCSCRYAHVLCVSVYVCACVRCARLVCGSPSSLRELLSHWRMFFACWQWMYAYSMWVSLSLHTLTAERDEYHSPFSWDSVRDSWYLSFSSVLYRVVCAVLYFSLVCCSVSRPPGCVLLIGCLLLCPLTIWLPLQAHLLMTHSVSLSARLCRVVFTSWVG